MWIYPEQLAYAHLYFHIFLSVVPISQNHGMMCCWIMFISLCQSSSVEPYHGTCSDKDLGPLHRNLQQLLKHLLVDEMSLKDVE